MLWTTPSSLTVITQKAYKVGTVFLKQQNSITEQMFKLFR